MSPETLHSFLLLALGFAMAGLLASLYQLITARPPGFHLLDGRAGASAFIAVPFFMMAAPFLIMRRVVRAEPSENRFAFAMLATVLAGLWSMLSGALVMKAIAALGVIT